MDKPTPQGHPKVAIVDGNTLAAMGLRQLLLDVLPIMTVDTFGSFTELESNHPDGYYHFFVAMDIVLKHRDFFIRRRQKTIVLTTTDNRLADFHSLTVSQPEPQLVRSLLMLHQHGHGGGRNLPPMTQTRQKVVSDREAEVMSLIVQGYINKEIADRLNIGLSTVITHRKNIMEKLGMRSVSALTIYAVMHGYVDIAHLLPLNTEQ